MSETNPRIRVCAVVVQEKQLLLVMHEKAERRYWLLPGGGVNYGERLSNALVRELKEETGLDVRVGRLLWVSESVAPDDSRHIVNLYFHAEVVGGEIAESADPRVVETRFVPISELEALTLYPDMRDTLIRGIREGLPEGAAYVETPWRED